MNEINYFEAQRRINRQTAYLYFLFALNLLVATIATNYIAMGAEYYSGFEYEIHYFMGFPLYSSSSLSIAFLVLSIIIVSYFYSLLRKSDGVSVALHAGGVEVTHQHGDPKIEMLNEVVEEISLASVVSTPRVFLLEGSIGINAFAAGKDRNSAIVAVTPDALDLERDELQALIAHEMAHIASEDVKLNWRSIAVLGAFMSLTSVGIYILSKLRYLNTRGSSNRNGRLIMVVVAFSLLLIVVGYLFYFIGRAIQSKISKQREYHADLNAVVALRQGMPMVSLLRKLEANNKQFRGRIPIRSECSHFLFSSNKVGLLFDTHPPLKKRIEAVFEHVSDLEMQTYLDARRVKKEQERELKRIKKKEIAALNEAGKVPSILEFEMDDK